MYCINIWNMRHCKSFIMMTFSRLWQANSIYSGVLCSVQNFKVIGQLQNRLWANKTSQDLSLRCVSDGNLIRKKHLLCCLAPILYPTSNNLFSNGPERTNFSEIWIKTQTFTKKIYFKMLSAKCQPFFLSLCEPLSPWRVLYVQRLAGHSQWPCVVKYFHIHFYIHGSHKNYQMRPTSWQHAMWGSGSRLSG